MGEDVGGGGLTSRCQGEEEARRSSLAPGAWDRILKVALVKNRTRSFKEESQLGILMNTL